MNPITTSGFILSRNPFQKTSAISKNRGFLYRGFRHSRSEEEGEKFKDYFSFEEPIKRIKSHRFLAVYRGQKEGVLKVVIEPPTKEAILMVADSVLKRDGDFKKEIHCFLTGNPLICQRKPIDFQKEIH